ncbi:MAG: hypothetical protein ABJL72_18205 [Roseobacter sp.]
MSETILKLAIEDMLPPKRKGGATALKSDDASVLNVPIKTLVLTSQMRVSDDLGVLRLMPEHAVLPSSVWQEYEEPPLYLVNDVPEDKPADQRRHSRKTRPIPVSGASDLAAKIAALETAIAKTVDQWEPDGAGRDAYAGTAGPEVKWQENVELDATGVPVPLTADETGKGPKEGASNLDIDEEMLRQMVAKIVRSELQGALGDRITRNVRNLVRREIQRALEAHALTR